MSLYRLSVPSPLGTLTCTADDSAVLSVAYTPDIESDFENEINDVLRKLRDQLNAYFKRELRQFDVPVKLTGTNHQLRVWNALRDISYGQTVTYADIAKNVKSAPIAVGGAVGKNRINILIPCHRVIGSDGSLTGYGGGLERKRALLELENET